MQKTHTIPRQKIVSEPAEEDWERELEAELKDYEVVPGQESKSAKSNDDWDEGQIDELLNDDEDLK